MDLNKIKIVYAGLQGLYSEAPTTHEFYTQEIWEQYHKYLKKLNTLTGESYDDYVVTPRYSQMGNGRTYVRSQEYKSKLNIVIRMLHVHYFSEEANPFVTAPNTIISQTQLQSQSQTVVLEIQSLLDKKYYTGNLDEKEKTFIEKVKGSLPTIKNTIDLLDLITKTANNLGLDVHQLTKIFGH